MADSPDRMRAEVSCSTCGQNAHVSYQAAVGRSAAMAAVEDKARRHVDDPAHNPLVSIDEWEDQQARDEFWQEALSPEQPVDVSADEVAAALADATTDRLRAAAVETVDPAVEDEIEAALAHAINSYDETAASRYVQISDQYRKGLLTAADACAAVTAERDNAIERRAASLGLVSGEPVAYAPKENVGEGLFHPPGTVGFHDDSSIGYPLKTMREDQRRMNVDGRPLADVIGELLTDEVTGRLTAEQALDQIKTTVARLPRTSQAYQQLSQRIQDVDAPVTPMPGIPAGTPAVLGDLAEELHRNPLIRRPFEPRWEGEKTPRNELTDLMGIITDWHAGGRDGHPFRVLNRVQDLYSWHHESTFGCDTARRSVRDAIKVLEELVHQDRKRVGPIWLHHPRTS